MKIILFFGWFLRGVLGIITVLFLTSRIKSFKKFDQVWINTLFVIVLASAAHTEMICNIVKGLKNPVSVDYILLP